LIVEQPTIDMRDLRRALSEVIDAVDWLLATDAVLYGDPHVSVLRNRLDLARNLLVEEVEEDGR
jgi:hypothetical protein